MKPSRAKGRHMQTLFLDLLINIVNEQWHKSLDLISRFVLIPHNCSHCQSRARNVLQRRKQLNLLDN